jgi:hypothetical protein
VGSLVLTLAPRCSSPPCSAHLAANPYVHSCPFLSILPWGCYLRKEARTVVWGRF